MSTLKARVEQQLLANHQTKTGLATAVGESSQNINNWLNRENIPHDKRDKVAAYLACSTQWLISGKLPKQTKPIPPEVYELFAQLSEEEAETITRLMKNIIERKAIMKKLDYPHQSIGCGL